MKVIDTKGRPYISVIPRHAEDIERAELLEQFLNQHNPPTNEDCEAMLAQLLARLSAGGLP